MTAIKTLPTYEVRYISGKWQGYLNQEPISGAQYVSRKHALKAIGPLASFNEGVLRVFDTNGVGAETFSWEPASPLSGVTKIFLALFYLILTSVVLWASISWVNTQNSAEEIVHTIEQTQMIKEN